MKSQKRQQEVSETVRVPKTLLTFLSQCPAAGSVRKFARGASIYRQGERASHFFMLVSGRIGISMLRPDGQELLIDIVGPGALCGEGAAFDGLPRLTSATALQACELLAFTDDGLCQLMEDHPRLAPIFVKAIALKQRTLSMRLAHITQASPEAKITELLTQIVDHTHPTISLTHQQIADLIGASRVTVTRAMLKLRRCGAVRYERGRCELIHGNHCG